MLKYIALIIVIFPLIVVAQQPTIEVLRLKLKKASSNEIECKKLIENLQSYSENNNPLFAGYKACATMLMAKHVYNPYSKLAYFIEGKKSLEKCIEKENRNIELRVLRLSVQSKAPAFLGYNNCINADKDFILKTLPKLVDSYAKVELKNLLINTNCLTNSEKQTL